QMQTDLSLQCYSAYQELALLKEKIMQSAKKLHQGTDKSSLEMLIGPPNPDHPDILYSSITVAWDGKETITSLQSKFLYLLAVLQSADAGPTSQTKKAIVEIRSAMDQLKTKIK
ncbi:MAG: hypothetical protein ABIR66_03895, partial [Saprospiraceae bacterium]